MRISFFRKAYDESKRISYFKGEHRIALLLSSAYYKDFHTDSAIYFAQEALSTSMDKVQKYESYRALGTAYFLAQEDEKSHANYLKALTIAENIDDTTRIAAGLTNVAIGLSKLRRYDESVDYYLRAYDLSKKRNDLRGTYYSALNASAILRFQKKLDSAFLFANEAASVAKEKGDPQEIAKANFSLSMISLKQQDYQKCVQINQETLLISDISIQEQGKAHFALAEAYDSLRNFPKAIAHATTSIALAKTSNDARFQMNGLGILVDAYAKINAYQKAFKAREEYFNIYKKVFTEQRANQMQELQEKYETEKKEAQIAQLNQQKAIDQLQLNQQRLTILVLVVIFMMMIILVSVIIRQNRYKTQR
ncbi:MAG: tetratricopeptide repeat protein, partial [Bacteroidota bacterium]